MAPHQELCGLQDEVSKLLDDYVGDVKQMDLQGVQHSIMEGHDDLGLLLHGQGRDTVVELSGTSRLSYLPDSPSVI